MKKKLCITTVLVVCHFGVFAESLLGFNVVTGYLNNNFEYEGLSHDVNYWSNFGGFRYTFYPSYGSFLGFSVNTNLFDFEVPFSRDISDDGRNSDYHYIGEDKYIGKSETLSFGFDADVALDLRFPVKNLDKSFSYLRLGGTYRIASWDAWMVYNSNSVPYWLEHEKSVDVWQNSFGILAEIGHNYGNGDVSLKFIYDLFIKSEMTGNEFIRPKSFGILFSCRPKTWRIQTAKDKAYLYSLMKDEDVFDDTKYKRYTSKNVTVGEVRKFAELNKNLATPLDEKFLALPINIDYFSRYYSDNEGYEKFYDFAKAFPRNISFTVHELGNGKPGTEKYITYTTKTVTLPFYTEEEKINAFNVLVEDYKRMKQQKERIAENRRLNPNNYDYQDLKVLSMATMGIEYAPNPPLIRGNVYIADQLSSFYIINRMENGDYNIGQESSIYGTYQFILKNSSGESMGGIGGHMFADTAYFRYLGTMEVITSNGYVRHLPYFEMLKKNPHTIRKIIKECEKW